MKIKRIHILLILLVLTALGVLGPRLSGHRVTLPATTEYSGNMLDFIAAPNPQPTWAGAYLSAKFAQENFDWARAAAFLTQAQKNAPQPGEAMARRLMVLSLNAGNIDDAIKYADSLGTGPEDRGLKFLMTFVRHMRAGDTHAAKNALDQSGSQTLLRFADPVLRAWIATANGSPDLTNLLVAPPYFYHAVLIADYADAIDPVADASKIQNALSSLSPISAENLGDIFARHGKFNLAEMLYARVAQSDHNSPALAAKITAIAAQKTPEHTPLFPKITTPAQGMAAVFLDMAGAFYQDNSFETAQVFAQVSLALDPSQAEAQLLIGNILAENDQIDAAIATYQKIPRDHPRGLAIQQQIAHLLAQQNQTEPAVATLRALLTGTADTKTKINLWQQIGDLYRGIDDFDNALTAYNAAFDLIGTPVPKENWDILYARGMVYERLKQWDKAESDLTAALAFQPDHPYILNYLGYSWADQGVKLDEAVKLLEHAVRLVPDDGYVTDSVGWVYYRLKKFDKAVTYLERAVELMPYDATINDHLGDAYQAVGRMREATFQWHRAYNYSEDDAEKQKIGQKLGIVIDTAVAPGESAEEDARTQ